ncbi:sulfurtransferase TusA family protein [Candidatus Desantisbacteria bacterium]|nr:sulfurtransferase TusA family protein [Candidatus Desantisbacteria bacterium]
MEINKTLDCIGLFCPMPVIKTKMELENMKSGEVLEILADDPGFIKDLPAWCIMSGENFLEIKNENGVVKGYVMKK